ncbi:hypothetical protein ACFQ07_18705 [Actinomadura adrarensis]|uniref:Uncharacterized protein n=1 Tax=Actinomadura adrarensis TaxID=1819600 RepID=A0ABW3CJ12_9ACTN
MSTRSGDDGLEIELAVELEVEVEAELSLAESSHPREAAELPPTEWLFDPVDIEREEVELRNILEAVQELKSRSIRVRRGSGESD